jgi:2-polyprenyl-3-methyl-5-hydroxy-6-metoxy-1,4-benzoquinol methylase
MTHPDDNAATKYYLRFAAAYARHVLGPGASELSDAAAVATALGRGIDLHVFKRSRELPRVAAVLGMLKGIAPASILDVGCGRGVFLWPLVEEFPGIPVVAIDRRADHIDRVNAVASGLGLPLEGRVMDACTLGLQDASVDVVILLEVLEHLENPALAVREALRIAKRFVLASVPSRQDDNPEHVRTFDADAFRRLFMEQGANGVKLGGVSGHRILLAGIRS